jgi:hypothetical protein
VVGAGLGGVTARQDCEGSRPSGVGQASDQASDVVGQAGAGSLRALRSQGTSRYGRLQLWATRAAGVSLPRRNSTRPSICPLQDGQLRSEPLSPPAPADRQPRRVPQTASQFRSVVAVLVSFVRSFSTNSRPALRAAACGGRPRAGGYDGTRASVLQMPSADVPIGVAQATYEPIQRRSAWRARTGI